MERWKKIFPALIGYGVIRGIITIVDGHMPNNPTVPFARLDALVLMLLLLASTILSVSFVDRKLHVADRIVVTIWVSCFLWSSANSRVLIIAPAIGTGSLFCAWVYDRLWWHPAGRVRPKRC